MNHQLSKGLEHDDYSGFEFSKELLCGDITAAVNFDRLQKHPKLGYIIIEYLLCGENQSVTPYTSHPNKYWHKNSKKFLSLWRAKLDFGARLYLVNYAKKGTKGEDEVLLIEVLDINEEGIQSDRKIRYTRDSFSKWFRNLNKECLTATKDILTEIYEHKEASELGKIVLSIGKHKGKTIEEIYKQDVAYLNWFIEKQLPYSKAALCYINKMIRK